jgi:hypothetical protein
MSKFMAILIPLYIWLPECHICPTVEIDRPSPILSYSRNNPCAVDKCALLEIVKSYSVSVLNSKSKSV